MNLRIIHKNLFNSYATLAMTVGASNSSFPLTNLKDDVKTNTWRSTNLSNPEIEITWSTGQTISGLALAFTNLIKNSTFRLRLYEDTAGTILAHDSGTITISESIDPPSGFTTINSSSFNFGGGIHASAFFNPKLNIRRALITLTSAGNPDGFIEIGRIIIGDSFEPEDNADYGERFGFEDTTERVRTSAGNLISDRGTISRFLEFSMGSMSENDNFALMNIFRRVGFSQPIFVNIIPQTVINKTNLNQQVYGVIDDSYSHILEAYNLYSSRIKIIEI